MTRHLRAPEGQAEMVMHETPWREPQWVYSAGFIRHPGLYRYFLHGRDRVRQAERDGISQVAPILVAFRADPAECRARIGKALWRQVHHSQVANNAWRARIKLQSNLDFATIMAIPTGALREIVGVVKSTGEAAVADAAYIATNRDQMRFAVMLARDVTRMGGQVDRRWSIRRLREEHDRLVREWTKRTADPTPWAEPWECKVDGFRFTRLVSHADFAAEGAVMHHCIASYANRAQAGLETAFRIEGRERASVSFTTGHVEIRSYHNRAVSEPCRRAAMKAWAMFKVQS